MNIEHIDMCVSNPIQMWDWHKDNLGFRVLKVAGNDSSAVVFLIDSANETILELGKLRNVPTMDFSTIMPIQFHIVIERENSIKEGKRLVAQGARYIGECPRNSYPGEKVFVRDPWGMGIQLVNRIERLTQ